MELNFWIRFITLFFSSVSSLLFLAPSLKACYCGRDAETFRIAIFRAELPGMELFHAFRYHTSANLEMLSDYTDSTDRMRNVREWQAAMGKNVALADIWAILYDFPAERFLQLWQEKRMDTALKNNSFYRALVKKDKREWLEYLVYAKQNEFMQYPEGETNEVSIAPSLSLLIQEGNKRLQNCHNPLLQKRYAFMLMRISEDNNEVIRIYDKYFDKPNPSSIIAVWALLFKAIATDKLGNHAQANYWYSLVFDWSNEKKIRAFTLFKGEENITKEKIAEAMVFARNNRQRAVLWAMYSLQRPAPAFDIIRKVHTLSPTSVYVRVLIAREINKLEDWLLTPTFTPQQPVIYHYTKLNRTRDLAYLRALLSFLEEIYTKSKEGNRAFIAAAIAHLHFLDDHIEEGRSWLQRIPTTAAHEVLRQRDIDELLITAYSGNLGNEATRQRIVTQLLRLEKEAAHNNRLNQVLVGIIKGLSLQCEKDKDFVSAGLLFNLSESVIEYSDEVLENTEMMLGRTIPLSTSDYGALSYFDRKASERDIELLLQLYGKKKKTSFERYLLRAPRPDSLSLLRLKGTIAFRRNDLNAAYKAFRRIPDSSWSTIEESEQFLNRDNNPFISYHYFKQIPGEESSNDTSISRSANNTEKSAAQNSLSLGNIRWNRATFVKHLIELHALARRNPRKRGAAYLQIANAYYNCSYWGIAWRMTMYEHTIYPSSDNCGYEAERLGSIYLWLKRYYPTYFKCSRAIEYYQKAARFSAKNPEQKAQALSMIFACRRCEYLAVHKHIYEADKRDCYTGICKQCNDRSNFGTYLMHNWNRDPILRQMRSLRNTETLRELATSCPLLEDYISRPLAGR